MGPNYYIVEDFKNLLTVHVTFSRSFKGRNINGVAYELGQYALSFVYHESWMEKGPVWLYHFIQHELCNLDFP